jgi:hypothetical protein
MFHNQWQVSNSLPQKQLKVGSKVLLALLKFALDEKLLLTLSFGDSYPFGWAFDFWVQSPQQKAQPNTPLCSNTNNLQLLH